MVLEPKLPFRMFFNIYLIFHFDTPQFIKLEKNVVISIEKKEKEKKEASRKYLSSI